MGYSHYVRETTLRRKENKKDCKFGSFKFDFGSSFDVLRFNSFDT
jgi:hypothetical protein